MTESLNVIRDFEVNAENRRLSTAEKEIIEETKDFVKAKRIWVKYDVPFYEPFGEELTGSTLNYNLGKLYIIGGMIGTSWSQNIFIFDTYLNVWKTIKSKIAPIAFHCATVLGEKIHVFGGQTESGVSDKLWEYDYEWVVRETNNPPHARSHAQLLAFDNTLVLFGGYPKFDPVVYQLVGDTWIHRNDTGDVPIARYGHTSCIYQEDLFVFGGKTESVDKHIYHLNLHKSHWKKYLFDIALTDPFLCWSHDESIYLIGQNGKENAVLQYNWKIGEIIQTSNTGDICNTPITSLATFQHETYFFSGKELYKFHLQETQNFGYIKLVLDKDIYCDIIFVVNGRKINGHKCVVSQSIVFGDIIQQTLKNRKSSRDIYIEITLPEVTNEVAFKYTIEFLYTGSITPNYILVDHFFDLCKMSQLFKINHLYVYLVHQLKSIIKSENVGKFLIFAHQEKLMEIKAFCMNYIYKHYDLLLKKGGLVFEREILNEIGTMISLHSPPMCLAKVENTEYLLFQYYASLHTSKQYFDITLKSKDGRFFKAHSPILCAFSMWFCNLFSSIKLKKGYQSVVFRPRFTSLVKMSAVETYKIGNTYTSIFESDLFERTEIEIEDFNAVQLDWLLEFIYTHRIKQVPQDVDSLLEMINCGQICKLKGMIDIGILAIYSRIRASNALKVIEFCDEHAIEVLLTKCWDSIKKTQNDELVQILLENQMRNSGEINRLRKKVEIYEQNQQAYQEFTVQMQQQITQLQRQLKKLSMSKNEK
jgi:hypothetical protein